MVSSVKKNYHIESVSSPYAAFIASTGVLDQITHYYAWGSVYGDMGSGSSLQPFKYGDKELDLSQGVARYDYSARAYFAAIPRFDRPDSYADNYPHISPYAFCANNPVNITDPTGERIICSIDGEEWEFLEGEDGYGLYNANKALLPADKIGNKIRVEFSLHKRSRIDFH